MRFSQRKRLGQHLQNIAWTLPARKACQNHDPNEQPAKQAGANLHLEGLPLADAYDAKTRRGIKHTATIKLAVHDVD
jgi:hypothetical protein